MTTVEVVLYFTAGFLLGAVYLGGLWRTVTWLRHTDRPLSFLAVSGLVRIVLLLGALALVSGLEWMRLASCIAGFVAARLVVTVWTRTGLARRDSLS